MNISVETFFIKCGWMGWTKLYFSVMYSFPMEKNTMSYQNSKLNNGNTVCVIREKYIQESVNT